MYVKSLLRLSSDFGCTGRRVGCDLPHDPSIAPCNKLYIVLAIFHTIIFPIMPEEPGHDAPRELNDWDILCI